MTAAARWDVGGDGAADLPADQVAAWLSAAAKRVSGAARRAAGLDGVYGDCRRRLHVTWGRLLQDWGGSAALAAEHRSHAADGALTGGATSLAEVADTLLTLSARLEALAAAARRLAGLQAGTDQPALAAALARLRRDAADADEACAARIRVATDSRIPDPLTVVGAPLRGADRTTLDALVTVGALPSPALAWTYAGDPLLADAEAIIRGAPHDGEDWGDLLPRLGSARLEALLARLDDSTVAAWGRALRADPLLPWQQHGPPRWEALALESAVLAAVSPASVERLARLWPQTRPAPPPGSLGWVEPTGPLDRADGGSGWPRSWPDVHQGAVGDCWLVAPLLLLGIRGGPRAYADVVRPNTNGTVTVRLHDDGARPREITVTRELPAGPDGTLLTSRGDRTWSSRRAELWPAYVEKAAALAHSPDGYPGLQGGTIEAGMRLVAGEELASHRVSDIDPAWLRDQLRVGRGVIYLTGTEPSEGDESAAAAPLTPNHAYVVTGVETDGRVALADPHGGTDPQGRPVMTLAELAEHGRTMVVTR